MYQISFFFKVYILALCSYLRQIIFKKSILLNYVRYILRRYSDSKTFLSPFISVHIFVKSDCIQAILSEKRMSQSAKKKKNKQRNSCNYLISQ